MVEVKISSDTKTELIAAIGHAVMRYQDASQSFDEAMGELYGLNAAERHCLSFIWPAPQTASAVAREIRLTPAAVTALIDRLERRDLVRRRPDPGDRRKVYVEATDKTRQMTMETYAPVVAAGAAMLDAYSVQELAVIRRFVEEVTAVQMRMTADLLERRKRPGPDA